MLCAESSLELPDSALEVVILEVLVKFSLPGFTKTFEERLFEHESQVT